MYNTSTYLNIQRAIAAIAIRMSQFNAHRIPNTLGIFPRKQNNISWKHTHVVTRPGLFKSGFTSLMCLH